MLGGEKITPESEASVLLYKSEDKSIAQIKISLGNSPASQP